MTITTIGDAMTEAHRRQQLTIGARSAMRTRRDYARLVVPARPATHRAFVDLTVGNVMQDRARSRAAASAYFGRMMSLEAPRSRYVPIPIEETDPNIEDRIRTSLYVMGSSKPRAHERAERFDKAAAVGRTGVAGAALRHALNGGRDQIIEQVKSTPVATGFVRVTANDNKVCWFCAMLASRTDYKEGSFDKSDPRFRIGGNPMANAKVHDNCRCMMRPIFGGDVPERNKRYEKLWYDLSEGSDDLATNFRRNWAAMVSSSQQP